MIINGSVVSLKRVAELNFDSSPKKPLARKLGSSKSLELSMLYDEAPKCFDPGFGYQSGEYLLGYNPLCQFSNFRNLVDNLKDLSFFVLLLLYTLARSELYFVGLPLVCNDLLMFVDLLVLKRHGNAETIDLLSNVVTNGMSVPPAYPGHALPRHARQRPVRAPLGAGAGRLPLLAFLVHPSHPKAILEGTCRSPELRRQSRAVSLPRPNLPLDPQNERSHQDQLLFPRLPRRRRLLRLLHHHLRSADLVLDPQTLRPLPETPFQYALLNSQSVGPDDTDSVDLRADVASLRDLHRDGREPARARL
jgi:hypothetical protein